MRKKYNIAILVSLLAFVNYGYTQEDNKSNSNSIYASVHFQKRITHEPSLLVYMKGPFLDILIDEYFGLDLPVGSIDLSFIDNVESSILGFEISLRNMKEKYPEKYKPIAAELADRVIELINDYYRTKNNEKNRNVHDRRDYLKIEIERYRDQISSNTQLQSDLRKKTGIPTLYTTAGVLHILRELKSKLEPIEHELVMVQAKRKAISVEILKQQEHIHTLTNEDVILKELGKIVELKEKRYELYEKMLNEKTEDGRPVINEYEIDKFREELAKSRIEQAKRKEEIVHYHSGQQLHKWNQELAQISISSSEKEALKKHYQSKIDKIINEDYMLLVEQFNHAETENKKLKSELEGMINELEAIEQDLRIAQSPKVTVLHKKVVPNQ